MKYFYRLDENNIVTDLTIAEDNFSADGWHSASLDTKIGVTCELDGGFFYAPSPFPSWIKDGAGDWKPPVEKPSYNSDTHVAIWSEPQINWLIVSKESEYLYHVEEIDRLGWLDRWEDLSA